MALRNVVPFAYSETRDKQYANFVLASARMLMSNSRTIDRKLKGANYKVAKDIFKLRDILLLQDQRNKREIAEWLAEEL